MTMGLAAWSRKNFESSSQNPTSKSCKKNQYVLALSHPNVPNRHFQRVPSSARAHRRRPSAFLGAFGAPESLEGGIHLIVASNLRPGLSFSVAISDCPGHAATDDEPSAHMHCIRWALPRQPRPAAPARVEAALALGRGRVISFASFRRLTAGQHPIASIRRTVRTGVRTRCTRPNRLSLHTPSPRPATCMHVRPPPPQPSAACARRRGTRFESAHVARKRGRSAMKATPCSRPTGVPLFTHAYPQGLGAVAAAASRAGGKRPVPSEGAGGGLFRATPAGVCRGRTKMNTTVFVVSA